MAKIKYFFAHLFKGEEGEDSILKKLYKKPTTKSILSSLISILIGIGIGFIVMLFVAIINENISIGDAFYGLLTIFAGPFSAGAYAGTSFGNMIFYSVPLIFTGLSVAVSQKTGLFNIGAAGQFLMGGLGSLLVALSINNVDNPTAAFFTWVLAVLVGIIFGIMWGMIPGIFKAYFGINEVIVCIMTNWIAANIFTWVFLSLEQFHNVGQGMTAYLILTETTGNFTPKLGLNLLFNGSLIDMGIFLAVIMAILFAVIFKKTIFGYSLTACGYNKDAAKYAGMNEKRNIVISMAIAGGLAGLGACLYYLNPGIQVQYKSMYQNLPAYGFNGIPAALLANNNPIGVIFSSIFIRYISIGGDNLASAGYNRYIAEIIIAVIIYLAGFSRLINELLNKKKKTEKEIKVEAITVNTEVKEGNKNDN